MRGNARQSNSRDAPSAGLARSQTHAEASLWRALRGRGLDGLKFVRQEPIGPYFADFVCRDKRLVVEIDGATHSTDEELRLATHVDRVSRARKATWSSASQTRTSIGILTEFWRQFF